MSKTVEQIVREKFATGYDPIQLSVSARSLNEENVEVTIEGVAYSIKGDSISHIGGRHRAGAEETAADNGAGTGSSGGLVSGESTEPVALTTEQRIQKLLEVPGVVGFAEIAPEEEGGEIRYALTDSHNTQLAVGTLDELEKQAAAA